MSRSTTQKYIVCQFVDSIPTNHLPTEKEVLKYLFHKKYIESLKSKKIPKKEGLICCPVDREHFAECNKTDSCTDEEPCVVRAVKVSWLKAGFPTVEDRSIR